MIFVGRRIDLGAEKSKPIRQTVQHPARPNPEPQLPERDRRLPAKYLRPVQAGNRDRPWRQNADQEKAAHQQVAVHPSVSSQNRAVETAQTLCEGDDDGNARAYDREKEKDAGVGIAAREQKGREEERAQHEHPTHNWSLRVSPRSP